MEELWVARVIFQHRAEVETGPHGIFLLMISDAARVVAGASKDDHLQLQE